MNSYFFIRNFLNLNWKRENMKEGKYEQNFDA